MCQWDFSHNIWGLGGRALFRGAGEFGDPGGEKHFQPLGGCLSGGFEAPSGTPVTSALDFPSLLTTEGCPPRGSLDHDKGDRRSWAVERNDPGRCGSPEPSWFWAGPEPFGFRAGGGGVKGAASELGFKPMQKGVINLDCSGSKVGSLMIAK
jgi:hypothetical protein